MTYLGAKIELLQETPRIPLLGLAVEAVTMTAVAGLLVLLFV